MSIVLFGKNGQLGRHITKNLGHKENFYSFDSSEVNFHNLNEIESCLLKYKPKIIINAAAFTKVDLAEEEVETAFQINTEAVATIAKISKEINAHLVHYSTDYVFDGKKSDPYNELDQTGPLGIYGKSKILGEKKILDSECEYYIFRTSWVISEFGDNFLLKMLKFFKSNSSLKIIDDQYGVPTDAKFLADNSLKLVSNADAKNNIINLVPSGSTSWYNLAVYLHKKVKNLSADFKLGRDHILPVSSVDYKTLAKRPRNSILSNEKFKSLVHETVPSWETNVDNVLNRIYKNS